MDSTKGSDSSDNKTTKETEKSAKIINVDLDSSDDCMEIVDLSDSDNPPAQKKIKLNENDLEQHIQIEKAGDNNEPNLKELPSCSCEIVKNQNPEPSSDDYPTSSQYQKRPDDVQNSATSASTQDQIPDSPINPLGEVPTKLIEETTAGGHDCITINVEVSNENQPSCSSSYQDLQIPLNYSKSTQLCSLSTKVKKQMYRKQRRRKNYEKREQLRLEQLEEARHPDLLDPRSICLFYMKGKCLKGADCAFSHCAVPPIKLEPCKFFLRNECAKGKQCLFMHSEYPCKSEQLHGKCNRIECPHLHGSVLSESLKKAFFGDLEINNNPSADT